MDPLARSLSEWSCGGGESPVEGGADIDKATNAGSTPLQIATDNQHTEIVHLLELAAQV
jgi:ankyrin repeat protein